MSLNRPPFFVPEQKLNWGIKWIYVPATVAVFDHPDYAGFFEQLPYETRTVLANAYFLVRGLMAEGPEMLARYTDPCAGPDQESCAP